MTIKRNDCVLNETQDTYDNIHTHMHKWMFFFCKIYYEKKNSFLGRKGRLYDRQMYIDITRFEVFHTLVFSLKLYNRSNNVKRRKENDVYAAGSGWILNSGILI